MESVIKKEEEEKTSSPDQQEQDEQKEAAKIKYYEWNEEMTSKAKEILSEEQQAMNEQMYSKYEKEAKRNWDIFYKNNKTNFYKDRHYIKYEFKELTDKIANLPPEQNNTKFLLLDAGCGVGNGFYPLYNEFKNNLLINCCDFSPRAVNFVKGHESFNAEHINASTCDVVNEDIPFIPNTADFGLFLFVLSAIAPENHEKVAQKLFGQMKEGGILYFRDYGQYDLAQLRLAQRKNQKLKDNFYIRSDKTRAYYFTIEEVQQIFEKAGFKQLENDYHYRLVENRKDQKRMHRVWIQAKFMRPIVQHETINQ